MPTIFKQSGWTPLRVIDLRTTDQAPGVCDRCGRTDLRFLHVIEDAACEQLQVGCECARRICEGYDAQQAENKLRNLWARRERWLSRDWRRSGKGNATLKLTVDGERVRVTIFPSKFGGWSYCIAVDKHTEFPPESFATADAAKLAAFDSLAKAAEW